MIVCAIAISDKIQEKMLKFENIEYLCLYNNRTEESALTS